MIKPKVLVVKADGINCDEELVFAFNHAGAVADLVHVNTLRSNKKILDRYNILAIPGGFSYGDDVISGKVLAIELASFFADALRSFTKRKNTITFGVCNGFQVLVRTGLLPFNRVGEMNATLTDNASGHFECRWVKTKVERGARGFLKDLQDKTFTYQVAHGEGRFYASNNMLKKIEQEGLVALRYVDEADQRTMNYPANPNGALHAIAGITDKTGRIIGLMPHPERFVLREQYPNFQRRNGAQPDGLLFFKSMIKYAKEL